MDHDGNSKFLDELYALNAMLEFSADRARRIGETSLAIAIDHAQRVALVEIRSCERDKTIRAAQDRASKKPTARLHPV